MHAAGRSPLLPRGVAGVSGYSPSKERRHAVDALKSPAWLRLRSQTMRYVVGAATWAGALRAAVDGLAACGWCCRHAGDAKIVQLAQYLNGHTVSLRRWLLCEACTSCGLYGSRIKLALGTLRGFIVHMDALDGPAKWLGLWHCWRRANSALVEAVKRPLGRPRVCPL